MNRPLTAPLLGLIAGIFLASAFSHPFFFFAILGIASLLFLAAFAISRKEKGIFFSSAILFVVVGYGIASFSLLRIEKASDLLQKTGEEKVYWVGRVITDCESEDTGAKTTVEVRAFRFGEVEKPVSGRAMVRIGEGSCTFREGDILRSFSAFKKPMRYRNVGSFDYPFFLLSRQVTATTFVESADFLVKVGEERGKFLNFLQALKEKTHRSFAFLPGLEDRQVLSAVLLGEKTGLGPRVEGLFRRTGTTHLLVVSGLHLVMVGGLFYFFFRVLLSLWPPLLLRVPARKWAWIAALVPIIFYAALVGFSPSVLRSVLTVVFLGALLFLSRQRDTLSILILVAFCLLLFQPLVLFDLSFQLSFLSVASILLFVPPWEAFLRKRSETFFSKTWVRRPMEVILASLAVQIGLFPVLVQRFHQMSLVSLPANLVLVPAFSLLLMPLGMLGMFFFLGGPFLRRPFFSHDRRGVEASPRLSRFFGFTPRELSLLAGIQFHSDGPLLLVGFFLFFSPLLPF